MLAYRQVSSVGAWSQRPYHLRKAFQNTWIVTTQTSLHAPRTNLYESRASYSSTSEPSHLPVSTNDLSDLIKKAYKTGETDAILDLSRNLPLELSPKDLVDASLDAAENNKGKLSGILNAFIGSGCLADDVVSGARLAWDLLLEFDDLAESVNVYPDVVTLSLAYSALCRASDGSLSHKADLVLERARKLSKKKGGSKRRRAMAASRRKGQAVYAKDVEKQLRDLCGPDFRVLYESASAVVVSKPPGMVCFHKHKTSAGKIRSSSSKKGRKQSRTRVDVSLEDALVHFNVPLSTLNHEGRGIVHRIDRGTSGCIALAKTDDMHAKLVADFFLRKAKKSYLAVVAASAKEIPSHGVIDIPVHGRSAQSTFSVVEEYGDSALCLRIETHTGRKHQVRVHCAEGLGFPILFDSDYSNTSDDGDSLARAATLPTDGEQQQFLLHASRLCIPGYDIDVEAPLPNWWNQAISSCLTEDLGSK